MSTRILRETDLAYQGSFRLNLPGMSYGGSALGYNPTSGGLFVVASSADAGSTHPLVAEVSIPDLVQSGNIADLHSAAYLQQPALIQGATLDPINHSGVRFGGLTVIGDRLYYSAYGYYDAAGVDTTFLGSTSPNLAAPDPQGLFGLAVPLPPGAVVSGSPLSAVKAGMMAGYLSPIPEAYQAAFGGPYYCGKGGGAIIARGSTGPTMVAFDPQATGPSPAPGKCWCTYPLGHTALASWDPNAMTTVTGSFFVSTASVVGIAFVGWQPRGTTWYGFPRTTPGGDPQLQPPDPSWVDSCNSGKGPHSLNGYVPTLWVHNPEDLLTAAHPWDVQPYEAPLTSNPLWAAQPCARVDAACSDGRGRLFLASMQSDVVGYARYPLVHVYSYPGA